MKYYLIILALTFSYNALAVKETSKIKSIQVNSKKISLMVNHDDKFINKSEMQPPHGMQTSVTIGNNGELIYKCTNFKAPHIHLNREFK